MIFKKKKKTPTPNCSICKWRSEEKLSYNNGGLNNACIAMGNENIYTAYNSKQCQVMFEEIENSVGGDKTEQEHSNGLINDIKDRETGNKMQRMKNLIVKCSVCKKDIAYSESKSLYIEDKSRENKNKIIFYCKECEEKDIEE